MKNLNDKFSTVRELASLINLEANPWMIIVTYQESPI